MEVALASNTAADITSGICASSLEKAPNPLKTEEGRRVFKLLWEYHRELTAYSAAAQKQYEEKLSSCSTLRRIALLLSRPEEFAGWIQEKSFESYAKNLLGDSVKNISAVIDQLEQVGLVSKEPILSGNPLTTSVTTIVGHSISLTSLGMEMVQYHQSLQPEMLPTK